MRLTQGAFSFLPDLTDEQIVKQIQYAINKNWAVNVEWTDDPHPRNAYWELWGLPLFGVKDAAAVMFEVNACRKARPSYYVKVNAFDNSRGVESCVLSFIVQRPTSNEPGFQLMRIESESRVIRYAIQPYATARPAGERY
uniref:Multifunctional fusion protein n=1 Tax=Storeatula sp. CCMP1868 TaxID=195070 RepID=A0A222AHQ7_9CRYP|nr:ribulose-1,5-bisphosphate carboxylase/oxygenase small subunit [Storeatula sp. CCMP1868]